MRRLSAMMLATLLGATPAMAHDAPGSGLPEKWGEALEDLLEDMGPALEEALRQMQAFGRNYDPRHYAAPEIQPNGDILIRRRDDAPDFVPDEDTETPAEPEDTIKL